MSATTVQNDHVELDITEATANDLLHEVRDGSLVVECPSPKIASQVTQTLYESEHPADVFHIEHYPITDDDDPVPKAVNVVIRCLYYDNEFGWMSSDVREEPDMVVSQ